MPDRVVNLPLKGLWTKLFPRWTHFPFLGVALFALGCGAPEMAQRASKFETVPKDAAVYVDGGYVGRTPTAFHLPAKPKVWVRVELPGYAPIEEQLYRDVATPPEAVEGVGWQDLYYYELLPRRE